MKMSGRFGAEVILERLEGASRSGEGAAAPGEVPFREAARAWARIGLQSFGGPAGQIAVMHRILVEEKRWIDERSFLHALNYCILLPGPEAQQLAVYVGWLLHGYRGGVVAGTLFVLPGFVTILALSVLYAGLQRTGLVGTIFFGLKAAVLAIVVEAVIRIGRRVLKNGLLIGIAALAFLALFLYQTPFPLVILAAAILGLSGRFFLPAALDATDGGTAGGDRAAGEGGAAAPGPGGRPGAPPPLIRSLRVLAVHLPLWLAPTILLAVTLGPANVYVQVGAFFSKAAVVTFGGAYAVLAYIAQQAVAVHGWLRPGEMLDGLGMAETTPGPLIMVVQFVGFMAAYRNPGAMPPMIAGCLGAILTTWVTFVPCFLWIFLGAPYVEALRGRRGLNAALTAVTAAVVGVILNLAVWFALHVLFGEVGRAEGPLGTSLLAPVGGTLDAPALLITAGALVAVVGFRVGIFKVLAVCTLVGLFF